MNLKHISRISNSHIVSYIAAWAVSTVAAAQCDSKIAPPDRTTDGGFGGAVSVSGNVAVIGVPRDGHDPKNHGSAFFHEWDGDSWVERIKVRASDPLTSASFGQSVSIEGNVAVIGAPRDYANGTGAGAAYVFRFDGDTWNQEGKLLGFIQNPEGDLFGSSVSISDDVIAIGLPGNNANGRNSGAVNVFRYNGTNWTRDEALIPDDNQQDDFFGQAVAVSGDVLVVGAWGDSGQRGSIYIYRWNGSSWFNEAELVGLGTEAGDSFGWSVDIEDDRIVVGAYADSTIGINSGSAFAFRYVGSEWEQEAELHAPDGVAGEWFGYSIALDDDLAVVGAVNGNVNKLESGAAYVFQTDGANWTAERKIIAFDGGPTEDFGHAVSNSGIHTLSSAIHADNSLGAVYGFLIDPIDFPLQPSDEEVLAGDPVCFSVDVDGGIGELSYQWRRNGKNLTDFGTLHGSRTDTLCLSEAYCADQGLYDVVVSDDCGSSISDAATLTVVSSPTLFVDATCPTGGPMSLSWDCATPNGRVAIIYSMRQGSFIIPSKYFCPGTQLDLGKAGIQLFYLGSAGTTGRRTIYGSASPVACDGYLQLLDVQACDTSNVVQIR